MEINLQMPCAVEVSVSFGCHQVEEAKAKKKGSIMEKKRIGNQKKLMSSKKRKRKEKKFRSKNVSRSYRAANNS